MFAEPLSATTIMAQLPPAAQALPLEILPSVDSTSEWCLRQYRQGTPPAFACLAEQQTQGRGRRGRQWCSPAGANIYLSLLWRFDCSINRLGLLPLVIGLAVRDCLRDIGISQTQLKWPNDVLVQNRKIAGVLIESAQITADFSDMIIGIGLNVAMPPQQVPPDIDWTDVQQQLSADSTCTRNMLVAQLLDRVTQSCFTFNTQPQHCLQQLKQCFSQPQPVRVLTEQGEDMHGMMLGISDRGELRVNIDGCERVFSSADISLHTLPEQEQAIAGHD